MANLVLLVGNLGDAPDLKYTKNKKAVAVFDVATTETWKDNGEKRERTEWTRVEVWNNRAEACARILTKGSMVKVIGKLHTNKWTGEDGKQRNAKVVRANEVEFIIVK